MKDGATWSLPKGWEVKKLLDVVDFQRGLTYSKNDEVEFSDNIVLRSNNVDLKTNKLDLTELKYIDPKIVVPENKKITRGSLLVCTANGSKSHLGKVALIDDDYDYAFGGFMGLIKPKKNLNSDFLFHAMTSEFYKKFIGDLSDGANINNLKFGDLGAFEIPLPPLPEQQRIVTILDEAFAAIAKAKANAEQNLRNAKELFESYLQGVFEAKGAGWEEKRLGEVAKHSLGKMLDKNKNKGVPQKYLRNQSVRWFEFDLSDLTEMPFLENEKEKYSAVKGDVLICEGGYPGRAAIWQEDYPIYFQKAIHRVRFHKPEYNKWFLYHLYLSDQTGKLKEYFSGTGIQHFTGEALAKYLIPLPPVNKVETIVQKLDALSAETKKLEAIYRQKVSDLEEMKKSILQKAFSGGLNCDFCD
jgi:type I restriction enzyme S subunit